MASCVSLVRDGDHIDDLPNLLSRLPVSCPHDREECLDAQVFVVRLFLISFLEHGDHVVVYQRLSLAGPNLKEREQTHACPVHGERASLQTR